MLENVEKISELNQYYVCLYHYIQALDLYINGANLTHWPLRDLVMIF